MASERFSIGGVRMVIHESPPRVEGVADDDPAECIALPSNAAIALIDQLVAKGARLKAALWEAKEDLNTMAIDKGRLRREIRELEAALDQERDRVAEKEEQYVELEAAMDLKDAMAEELEMALDQEEWMGVEQGKSFQANLAKEKTTTANVHAELARAKKATADVQKELTQAKKATEDVRTELAQEKRTTTELRDALDRQKKDYTLMRDYYEQATKRERAWGGNGDAIKPSRPLEAVKACDVKGRNEKDEWVCKVGFLGKTVDFGQIYNDASKRLSPLNKRGTMVAVGRDNQVYKAFETSYPKYPRERCRENGHTELNLAHLLEHDGYTKDQLKRTGILPLLALPKVVGLDTTLHAEKIFAVTKTPYFEDGVSLWNFFARATRPHPISTLLSILAQIAACVLALDDCGVRHGDLHDGNIMVVPSNARKPILAKLKDGDRSIPVHDFEVRLIDWDFASFGRENCDEQTLRKKFVGTGGSDWSPASDLFRSMEVFTMFAAAKYDAWPSDLPRLDVNERKIKHSGCSQNCTSCEVNRVSRVFRPGVYDEAQAPRPKNHYAFIEGGREQVMKVLDIALQRLKPFPSRRFI
jgi:hypothetical protein